MGTLRDDLLPVMGAARGLIEDLGFRTNGLTIVTRVWGGGAIGRGTPDDGTPLVLAPRPKIRQVSLREINGSGGQYQQGDLTVTGITPYDATTYPSGYTPEQLSLTVTTDDTEVLYVVDGPLAGNYGLVELKRDRALGYGLVLRRTNQTP